MAARGTDDSAGGGEPKVWGGNRTWRGARWQRILTSVLRTCEQRARSGFDFLRENLCRPIPQLLPA